MRSSRVWLWLPLVTLTLLGCSASKKPDADADNASGPIAPKPSVGAIVGTAQLALKSGDVKNLAFVSVRLVQQEFQLLTPSEKEDIAFDVDQGIKAEQYDLMSSDEVERKTQAKANAVNAFEVGLPRKAALVAWGVATTDGNGSFRFDGVPAGTYFVNLDTTVAVNYIGWSVKVEVSSGQTARVDLNNTNADYAFY